MSNEEKLIRLSLIGTVLSFYKDKEVTKTINKMKKNVRKSMKSLSKTVGMEKTVKLISDIDPYWKNIFEKYSDEKFSASSLIITIWKPELQKHISHSLLDKYCASEVLPSDIVDIEMFTYTLGDEFDVIIKEIL